jgi:hypothetical protein
MYKVTYVSGFSSRREALLHMEIALKGKFYLQKLPRFPISKQELNANIQSDQVKYEVMAKTRVPVGNTSFLHLPLQAIMIKQS